MVSELVPKTILVGGIHGVGKSYYARKLSSELSLPHFSAGELISDTKKARRSNSKDVSDIEGNQSHLLEALQGIKPSHSTIILDGHFCVFDEAHRVCRLPIETFTSLNLLAVIILTGPVDQIRARLNKRDGREYSAVFLETFQTEEIEHAKFVCSNISIGIRISTGTDGDQKNDLDFLRDQTQRQGTK